MNAVPLTRFLRSRWTEEVAQQSLSNVSDHERYRSAWQRHVQAASPKRKLGTEAGGTSGQ